MRLFRKTNIDFVGKRYTFFGITLSMLAIGIVSVILHGGLNMGVDFAGGLVLEVKFKTPVQMNEVRSILTNTGISFELQNFPKTNTIVITSKGTQEAIEGFSKKIRETFAQSKYTDFTIERTEFVGPRVGKLLAKKALLAILFSFAGIIVYVAFRFKSVVWGVSGVIALMHDVFITVGLLSVLNIEFTLTVLAALLTLAGYSINDTIVVYDRIRENLSLLRRESLFDIINISMNQTLSRTLITGITTLMVLLALILFGGAVIHDFAFTLFFGIIIGTYSSVFVASPIVYEWITLRTKKLQGQRK